MDKPKDFEHFLQLSVVLTGFNRTDLLGTGLAQTYFESVSSIVGDVICTDLWSTSASILRATRKKKDMREEVIREELLSSPKFGPLVRNLIKLWYLGQWDALPASWRSEYGNNVQDVDQIISPMAYKEGLVWTAIGAHPMGAKQPGFGTWSHPPNPPSVDR